MIDRISTSNAARLINETAGNVKEEKNYSFNSETEMMVVRIGLRSKIEDALLPVILGHFQVQGYFINS